LSLPQVSFVIEGQRQNKNTRPISHGRLVYGIVIVDDDHFWMYQMDDDFRSRSIHHSFV